jgi:glycosyltransferase involved in cell wall biosynthesis
MSENQKKHFEIENVIPPEIKDDVFYRLIMKLGEEENLTHVLEIGSSSGAGSTEAFVRGLSRNKGKPTLYCLEISPARFQKLTETYKSYGFVKTYNASSVGPKNLPSAKTVSDFYDKYKLPLRLYGKDSVLKWLKDDADYLGNYAGVEPEGIELIKRDNAIDKFDMVLIDGSEFLGSAELDHVYGAKIILLDDTRAYKTFECCERLKNDPRYELIVEDKRLRNGFAAFRLRDLREKELPVHFFTIVLNGKPFIDYHIDMMRKLPFKWVWHIVEGVADLVNDTGWSKASGGRIPDGMHKGGLSNDGTSEYIDELAAKYPENVKVYRKGGGHFWNGKKEMCNAALSGVREECLLWQLDVDELWTAGQVTTMRQMFMQHKDRTSAFFWCHFFFGKDRIISTRNCYAENPSMEWLRVWRFRPGMTWVAHEPPVLAASLPDGRTVNQGAVKPFTHAETEKAGLVFQHYAYATREQVEFKESYYGYKNAVAGWERLQSVERLPVPLCGIIPWVNDGTLVDRAAPLGVNPLATVGEGGKWSFRHEASEVALEVAEGKPNIVIDGVFFQYYRTGIARVWNSLLKEWSGTDFARRLVVLDRGGSMGAERIPGITYVTCNAHSYGNPAAERNYLDTLCHNYGAGVFTSTYYSHTGRTPYVMMVHDMIPELSHSGYNLNDPAWVEKHAAIDIAKRYVCVSAHTAGDLIKYCPGVVKEHVVVAHNGLAGQFRKPSSQAIGMLRHRYGIKHPYFMLSGARSGYKNGISFFRAFNMFPAHGGFDVLCTGPQGLEKIERDMSDGSYVANVMLDEQELVSAYGGATALVVPSLYEGFGLPVLEAMACGCPVICSNMSSLPEVAGDAALMFDPHSIESLADCMAEVLKPSVRSRLIAVGLARAEQFSWKKMADKLQSVLESVADGHEYAGESFAAFERFPGAKAEDAMKLMAEGKVSVAVAMFDEIAARETLPASILNDRAVAHFQLAQSSRSRSEAVRALDLLTELSLAEPRFVNVWKNLFVVAGSVGDRAAQKRALESLSELNPNDENLKLMRGQLGGE